MHPVEADMGFVSRFSTGDLQPSMIILPINVTHSHHPDLPMRLEKIRITFLEIFLRR